MGAAAFGKLSASRVRNSYLASLISLMVLEKVI